MSGSLHPITIRLSQRAREVLQAIADDCGTGEGRAASELMELALTGRERPASERLTRKPGRAAADGFVAGALREQQARVLASLRQAMAEKNRRAS